MARFRTVLGAVTRAAGRRSMSVRQVSGNNMFYAGVALCYLLDPVALGLFMVLIGIVVFLPSSSDPMTAVPQERLRLWPLTQGERTALRMLSPLLNPLAWLILGALAWRRLTWGLWAVVASIFLAGFLGSALRSPQVWIPALPLGRLAILVRRDLRQFATALDIYCALLLSVPAAVLRWRGQLPADALVPLTGVVIIILSTLPLTLFGLDGPGGLTRYTLWPLAARRVLLAKGIAYLLIVLLVTLPLSPLGALAGGLVALGVGQWHGARFLVTQSRWRFRSSTPFATSLAQMILALLAYGLVAQEGAGWLVVPMAFYGVSLWLTARRLAAPAKPTAASSTSPSTSASTPAGAGRG
jgi:hypothetical protein